MTELPILVLSLLAGGLLGVMFFAGLWWTVRLGVLSPSPAIWFLASFFLRTALLLAGFYLVGRGDWHRLLACLVGFVLARVSVTWLTGAPVPHKDQISPGAPF